ncbi:MAG: TonB-dependent receptor plug domain-containing protein, partial [Ginsengibacter sp.]
MQKKNHALKRILLCSVFLLTLAIQNILAQQPSPHIIEGIVSNEKGEPLQGVVVHEQSTNESVVTDASGKFKISVSRASAILVITNTGYSEKLVAVSKDTGNLNIALSIYNKELEEVVVVGYNTVKRKDVTGAVSGIGQEEIKSRPVDNALEAMQGKVAGVDISSNERPGTIGDINIRGVRSLTASNSPLFVVDGIPLITGGIENINPGDIESIDILKDASATAIYGSRGANGVVIVTTKQGKAGKATLNLNSSVTFENLVDNEKMYNAGDFITFRRWAYYYAGLNATTGISSYPRGDQPDEAFDKTFFSATADPYAWANIAQGWASGTWDPSKVKTTDWRGKVTQQGVTSNNTISVSGGTDKIKAYGSFGYLNNTGTIHGQSFERYTARANVDIA